MTFRGDRLRARRKFLRLSQGALGDMVGLSQRAISDLEKGETMKTDKLEALARACGVSPGWLQGSEDDSDDMRADRLFSPKERDPVPAILERRGASMAAPDIANLIGKMLPVREIDVRGGASYGGGIIDEPFQEGGKPTDKVIAEWGLPSDYVKGELGLRPAGMDIIKVRGDSMDDGTARSLASGDRVMVDRDDRDVRQGGIFVVFDGEGVIIKQVELERGVQPPRIVCKSLNTTYSPIVLTLELPVQVIGRVAARISRM